MKRIITKTNIQNCGPFGTWTRVKVKNLDLIKNENEPTEYTDKREVVNKLKELVSLGENIEYQKQHIENIKDMVGEDRIFK